MRNKFLLIASLVLAFANVSGVMLTQQTHATDKVAICHATNAAINPYILIEVSDDAVDGDGQSDHMHHTGPIATSLAHAAELKDSHIDWGDIIPTHGMGLSLNWNETGQSIFNKGCNFTTEVIPADVTFINPTCSALGSYIIPSTTGVDYMINGEIVAAGTYNNIPDGRIIVTAVAQTGYHLKLAATDRWAKTFRSPDAEDCMSEVIPATVTFTNPNCDDLGSYVIPRTVGVRYLINDVVVAAGTYNNIPDGKIKIVAEVEEGYKFAEGVTIKWETTFKSPSAEECVLGAKSVTPAAVTFTAPTCDLLGFYTVPTSEGIKYTVDSSTVTAGNHTVANGTTVTVTATALEGYEIKKGATNTWRYTFTAPTGCVLGASTTATTLPVTSGDSTIANVIILSFITGIITMLGLVLRKFFARQF